MHDAPTHALQAILLLGPTGAGKTPLGDWLEAHGLWARPCHHFDFGANLRAVAAGGPSEWMTRDEVQFLQRVLDTGALLENESFYLAAKILEAFVARRAIQTGHWLILNGLPRHVAQAQALEARVAVRALVQLECDARVVRDRLQRDPGGDRALRADDTEELVARKLKLYEERTRPLLDYYRQRGAELISVPVTATTRPPDIADLLERWPCGS
jgi:adenylate kinase family enzyme